MLTFVICLVLLLAGFLVYSRIADRVFQPHYETTPAVQYNDGVDYEPLPTWKAFVIELLNIAGTGPIFGAVMGAMWGPIVFFWIVGGCILGGGIHDFMSGMMSVRNRGRSVTSFIPDYLGKYSMHLTLAFTLLLCIMVGAVFTKSAADIMSYLTGLNVWFWIAVVLAYFLIATLLPISKVIGRIYPIFGILLVTMAVVIIGGLVIHGYSLPEMELANLHPSGTPAWPFMFLTVACGAVSGFHATQSPIMARCLKDERKGRHVFYGAMVAEGIIAMVWASAGMAFFGDTVALGEAISLNGTSSVVYQISEGSAGIIGGTLAIIGVVICPITTGDTALRSARLIISDHLNIDPDDMAKKLAIVGALGILVIFLTLVDFTILWRYFSWLNQTLAAIVLWTASMYILFHMKNKLYTLMTALPATFMTAVVTAYILTAPEGFGLDYTVSMIISCVFSIGILALFIYRILSHFERGKPLPETLSPD